MLNEVEMQKIALYNDGYGVPCKIFDADWASRQGTHVTLLKKGVVVDEFELGPRQKIRVI